MARAIYVLKMYMFQRQISLSPEEKKGNEERCIFIVGAYVKAWFLAPSAPGAPNNDLKFLKLLSRKKKRGQCWSKALANFLNHLWYLSSDLISFAFYDESVSIETKRKMSTAVLNTEGMEDPSPRMQLPKNAINEHLDLDYFVTKSSKVFFGCLKLSKSFLSIDPSEWEN